MTRAMYPGSFDPVHIGHVHVVEAAARIFDEVIVIAMANDAKASGLFSLEDRAALLHETFADFDAVQTGTASGLVIQAAAEYRVDVIVKGLRSVRDFDGEMEMAHMNHHFGGIETLFIPSRAADSFVSSRYIREMFREGEDVSALVPPPVAKRLQERTQR